MVAVAHYMKQRSNLVSWRTAFWSAVVTTPVVAGVLGEIVGLWQDG